MLDPKNIHEIIQQVVDALPEGLKNMPNDVRQNMRDLKGATKDEIALSVLGFALSHDGQKADEIGAIINAFRASRRWKGSTTASTRRFRRGSSSLG